MTNDSTPKIIDHSNPEVSGDVRKVTLDAFIAELKRRGKVGGKGPVHKLDSLKNEVDELIRQGFKYGAVYEFALSQGFNICKSTAFKFFKMREELMNSEVKKPRKASK